VAATSTGQPPPASGPAGYLVDQAGGIEYALGGTTVIGSDPGRDPAVAAGAATMITVDDPGIDEVQVTIRISGSTVTAESAGGAGSWIQEPDGPTSQLTATPQPLEDGAQLWLGSHVFSFRPAAGPGR
jgi:hypothetical protein